MRHDVCATAPCRPDMARSGSKHHSHCKAAPRLVWQEPSSKPGYRWFFASPRLYNFVMKRIWLVFSQAVTVVLAAYFVLLTLKPS
ncbi:MAG: hypothetical protein ACO27O_12775, partial [Hylemonella sp.]